MRRLAFTLFLLACLLPLMAQATADSAGVRYWFDDNIATVQTTATGTQRLDISALRPGLHTLHAQVQHTDGTVGYIRSESFLIPYVSADTASGAASIRYWFDEDLAAVQTTTAGLQRLDITALRPGVHTLHVQVLHTDGSVGYIRSEMFMIPYVNNADEALYCRYWFDTNLANAKIAAAGAQRLDVYDLAPGEHTLHVQVVHPDGSLGYIRSEKFTVPRGDVAETYIQVGTDSETGNTVPFNNYYMNSWSQAIYTAQELTRGGTIHSLQFHCAAIASEPFVDDELTIYMAHTTKTIASDSYDWIPAADLVQVYSVESFAHPTDTGWFFIDLQTPFQYNGTDNLALVISRHSSAYAEDQVYTYSTVESGAVLYRENDSDSSYGDYPGTASGTEAAERANTIFGFLDADCQETTLFSDTATICANETYLWRGQLYSTAGFYSDTVRTEAGCERIYQLTLNVAPAYTITDSATICEGETYTWHGRQLTESGQYLDSLLTINGCDSICILNLTFSEAIDMPVMDTMVCEADLPILWHGMTLVTAGSYYDTVRYATGCDSLRYTLNLTVLTMTYAPAIDTTVCEGDATLMWRGKVWPVADTTYFDTQYYSTTGCDSALYTLNVTVDRATYAPAEDRTICENSLPFSWRGMSITAAGTYYDTTYYASGCVSAYYTLNLTVNSNYETEESATVCESEVPYIWHGENYYQTGDYETTLKSITGCDSVVTLHLTVLQATDATAVDSIVCEADMPIMWHGKTLVTAGSYYDTVRYATGCDSLRYTLNLTVNATYTVTEEAAICDGDIYTWHGRTYTKKGIYTDTLPTLAGCDSICTLVLTVNPQYLIEDIVSIREDKLPYIWQGEPYNEAGNYHKEFTSIYGCDSVHTLQLIVTELPIYTVTVIADHGVVNGTGTYPLGTNIHLEAIPDEGFEFQMWSDGSEINPKDFVVTQDTTLRALFFMPEVEQVVIVDSIETNSVTIVWDTVAGATLYELRIFKNGELVVIYEVDPDNNIVGEHHTGPDRLIARKDSTGGSSETLQVSVGGLEPGQDYTYSLDAMDDDRSYVGAQSGSFTTEEEPDGLDSVLFDDRRPQPRKILQDGHLYIELPDGTRYSPEGALLDSTQ